MHLFCIACHFPLQVAIIVLISKENRRSLNYEDADSKFSSCCHFQELTLGLPQDLLLLSPRRISTANTANVKVDQIHVQLPLCSLFAKELKSKRLEILSRDHHFDAQMDVYIWQHCPYLEYTECIYKMHRSIVHTITTNFYQRLN